jgi:hypothetical protein
MLIIQNIMALEVKYIILTPGENTFAKKTKFINGFSGANSQNIDAYGM